MAAFACSDLKLRSGADIQQGDLLLHQGTWCLVTNVRRDNEFAHVLPLSGEMKYQPRQASLAPSVVLRPSGELLFDSDLALRAHADISDAVGSLAITAKGAAVVCAFADALGGITLGGEIVPLESPIHYCQSQFTLVAPLSDGGGLRL